MDIVTKRVYDPAAPEDGARFLVDRLWPRGISKERAALTAWLRAVAPSDALRKRVHADPGAWDDFVRDYRAELAHPKAVADLHTIRAAAAQGRVTLLFAASSADANNATVLRDFLLDANGGT